VFVRVKQTWLAPALAFLVHFAISWASFRHMMHQLSRANDPNGLAVLGPITIAAFMFAIGLLVIVSCSIVAYLWNKQTVSLLP
jgi:hypothetical protein